MERDGEKTELIYKGYDKGTVSLRYGFKPQKHDKKIFRAICEEDKRIFTPVDRSSHKWSLPLCLVPPFPFSVIFITALFRILFCK